MAMRLFLFLLVFIIFDANAQKYLLIGTDTGNKGTSSSADMILITSITKKNVKLASLMIDTYVSIPNKGMDKLNKAFSYGNAELLMRTVNSNFNLKINDYIIVDFTNMPRAVDILGGLYVDVKADEIKPVNDYLKEQSIHDKSKPIYIKKAGSQLLNGDQVLAYSRIKSTTTSDWRKAERQKEVLMTIIKKMSQNKMSFKTFQSLYTLFDTNIELNSLIQTMGYIFSLSWPKTDRFPQDSDSSPLMINKVWYLKTNLKTTGKKLNKFLSD